MEAIMPFFLLLMFRVAQNEIMKHMVMLDDKMAIVKYKTPDMLKLKMVIKPVKTSNSGITFVNQQEIVNEINIFSVEYPDKKACSRMPLFKSSSNMS